MHYGNGLVTRCRDVLPSEAARCSDLNSTLFLKRMIEAEKPDLIAFTGSPTDSSSSGTSIFAWKIPCFTRIEGALEIHLLWPCLLSYSCSLLLRSFRVAVAEAIDPLFLVGRLILGELSCGRRVSLRGLFARQRIPIARSVISSISVFGLPEDAAESTAQIPPVAQTLEGPVRLRGG